MSEKLSMLYEESGRAMHKAQLVEYNLVSIMILLSKIEVSKPKEADPEYWSDKNLGWLLHDTIKSNSVPEEMRLFLETVVNARNHLAHKLFLNTDMTNDFEINRSIREVKHMQEVFNRGYDLTEEIMQNIANNEFGIDLSEIKKRLSQKF